MRANILRARSARPVIALIAAGYLLVSIAITFPFVLHPQSTLTAPLPGDVSGSISKFQTLVAEHKNPFRAAHLVTVGYPTGVTTEPGVDRVAFLNSAFLWGSSIVFGAVAAHGLLTILGFTLTALISFLFVRRVTGSVAAGFVAGLTYGFWGHMYMVAAAAPTYTHMWMLVLPIWAWFELGLRPALGPAIVAGLSPLPAMFWTPYYALHVTVVVAACVAVLAIRALVMGTFDRRSVRSAALAMAMPLLAGASMIAIIALSRQSGVPSRPLEDAFLESAHPLMYVIPGYASSWSQRPYELLVQLVPRAKFANLYVGLSVIALSVVAIVAAVAALRGGRKALSSPVVLATVMGSAVVFFCFMFSLPPRIAAIPIPMPDALVIAVQPAFRAGQRFVMPLMAGLSILAGLGASALLRRVASPRAALALVALIAMVVGLDNFARPRDGFTGRPEAVSTIPRSAALAALMLQPQAPAFQYVDRSRTSRLSEINPCLLQPQHGKTLVASCGLAGENTSYQFWDATRTCDALNDMRGAGVRYVIVDTSIVNIIDCLQGPLAGADEEIGADPWVVVYRLD